MRLWPGVFLYSFILLVGMVWYGLVWYGLVFNGVMMNLDSCHPLSTEGSLKTQQFGKHRTQYQLSTTLGKDL